MKVPADDHDQVGAACLRVVPQAGRFGDPACRVPSYAYNDPHQTGRWQTWPGFSLKFRTRPMSFRAPALSRFSSKLVHIF